MTSASGQPSTISIARNASPAFSPLAGTPPARHVLGVSRTRASHGPQALDGVDRDDVRMIQRGDRLRFALEALATLRDRARRPPATL
jgi:hypothetical protein